MKFNSVEHEVIFKKLIDLDNLHNETQIEQTATPNDTSVYLNEIHIYIKEMLQTRENYAYRYLNSHRKVLGPLIVFAKKVIRKLLKWYIEPIAFQQTRFNNAVTPAIGRTTELVTELINKTNEMERLYNSFIKEIEVKQTQYDALTKQMEDKQQELYDEMKMKIKQKEEQVELLSTKVEQLQQLVDVKISNLEKSHNIYSERIDNAATKLNKLEEIDLFKDSGFDIFNKHTYSQSGEDSILAYIIHVLGIPFESIDYIDMGANHAKEMSNTYFFYSRGAKGVLVEANPELIPELKFYRHRDIILNNCVDVETGNTVDFYILNGDGLSTPDYNAAKKFCEINPALKIIDKKQVKTISYKTIVEDYLGKAPTILSIDIEGKDLEILHSIDYQNYRPLIIVTEMINYDTKLSHNTKNDEIKQYLNSMDYDEYAFTGINSIFLDRRFLSERIEAQG
ncbi:FkbM family methyltransferase [Paenibacillus naphthalenovorans]|uniref:FkbM family methyltransferase n=1 Tax=Paenibacillus naphthalenovorans TaxID=162209 RepID=UPI003D283FDD